MAALPQRLGIPGYRLRLGTPRIGLIGMVTDRDIVCRGLAGNNSDAHRATARDVMTPGIHCCREDDDIGLLRDGRQGAQNE
jgi:CBS domain-containing protein